MEPCSLTSCISLVLLSATDILVSFAAANSNSEVLTDFFPPPQNLWFKENFEIINQKVYILATSIEYQPVMPVEPNNLFD